MEGLAKEQTCMTHRHRQQCGHGQREVRWEVGGSGQREERGTSVIVTTIKIELKILIYYFFKNPNTGHSK